MNEKKFINICYEYINQIITYDEFIKGLEICNKNNKEITRFIEEINGVKNAEIITYDEDVLKQKKIIDKLIGKLKLRYINENNKVKKGNINKEIVNLEKDKDNLNNSLDTWSKIVKIIENNNIFNKIFDQLSVLELLNLIAKYISVPFPPYLNQEQFNELVNVGIAKNENEMLYRLVTNYSNRNINFDLIVDYYIKTRNGYYLSEIISCAGTCLDLDYVIKKINDKILIDDLYKRKDVLKYSLSESQFDELFNKKIG